MKQVVAERERSTEQSEPVSFDKAEIERRARAMRAAWVRDFLKRVSHRAAEPRTVSGLGQPA